MAMKRRIIIAAAIAAAVLGIAGAVIFNAVHNASFNEMKHYIREHYSIVKKVDFTDYHSPYCSFDFYVEPDCTYEQAKEIFEDFANKMSDDLIIWLREKMRKNAFLDADFISTESNLSIYRFETGDLENFVHWKAEYGDDLDYEFDRAAT